VGPLVTFKVTGGFCFCGPDAQLVAALSEPRHRQFSAPVLCNERGKKPAVPCRRGDIASWSLD